MERLLVVLEKQTLTLVLLKKDPKNDKVLLHFKDAYGSFESDEMIEDITKMFRKAIGMVHFDSSEGSD